MKSLQIALIILCSSVSLSAQTKSPDLADRTSWEVINRSAKAINENGKDGVFLNAMPGDGCMILKNYGFSSGVIELDIKGKDAMGESFVGIAFHIQKDTSYDAVYFRPFNFFNTDTLRSKRSVQYISMPDFPWEKLRESWPGKYENKVSSVQDANNWFHLKLVIQENKVKAFVNHDTQPCLEVDKLSVHKNGAIALWVGNTSSGGFSNLRITPQ